GFAHTSTPTPGPIEPHRFDDSAESIDVRSGTSTAPFIASPSRTNAMSQPSALPRDALRGPGASGATAPSAPNDPGTKCDSAESTRALVTAFFNFTDLAISRDSAESIDATGTTRSSSTSDAGISHNAAESATVGIIRTSSTSDAGISHRAAESAT